MTPDHIETLAQIRAANIETKAPALCVKLCTAELIEAGLIENVGPGCVRLYALTPKGLRVLHESEQGPD